MVEPTQIDADGKCVVVKLMDESWIWNECVGAHPIRPRPGVVWAHSDHCARLPIPGDELPLFVRQMCESHGNCAAMAWHGEYVLGHIVWLPRAVARDFEATGWEHFGEPEDDGTTLVVINFAFCSLSRHEFRRKGVGKALVATMLHWARENGWRRVEVYDTPSGLFPCDWYDSCIPPRPFWEGRDFQVVARHGDGTISEERLRAGMADNPRSSEEEQQQKTEIIAALKRGEADPELVGYSYDLGREI